ncbi:uncharacterized protein FIBRA_07938 [Fibroporia radiculosa]|uniref:Peptidase A1 domain-containing protein n=1 Tax=Fibroporia radiculosa TaxID=599839 RepID=J4IC32_9APHY|nr:uncharacterized protein FIBRA_07938 [Fibroporia radiculosa]CCM05706.1 predicted protein [Fibroporia radiculosa]
MRHAALSFIPSVLLSSAFAINIPFRKVHTRSSTRGLHSINVTRLSESGNVSVFENIDNIRYVGDIALAGDTFEVILDTGSNDFWIYESEPLSQYYNTSIKAADTYGPSNEQSKTAGYVILADVVFGGFNIQNQSLIKELSVSSGILNPGVSGVVGLGPPTGYSSIIRSLTHANSTINGTGPMENIFLHNPDMEPQFTILMSRNDDTNVTAGGSFTIGEPISEYAAVTQQPVLPLLTNATHNIGLDYWTIHVDAITINGKRYDTSPSGTQNISAFLDTGTPTALVDPMFVDAIYGSSLQTTEDGTLSFIPCDTYYNVSIELGGVEYPLNPLDMIWPWDIDENGNAICVGALQRNTYLGMPKGTWILGDTFLRNVYSLFNMNLWNKSGGISVPFVQLLSLTNATEAHIQFTSQNAARMAAFQTSEREVSGFTPVKAGPNIVEVIIIMSSIGVLLLIAAIVWAVKVIRRRRALRLGKYAAVGTPGDIPQYEPPSYRQYGGSES